MYEALVAMQTGAKLQMCMADVDASSFFSALKAGHFDTQVVCGGIDCNTASSSEPSDRSVILAEIERTVGADVCNRRLRGFLQEQFNLTAINATQISYYTKG